MIEPVPTFWNEFLNLIQMMKMLLEGKNKKEFNILNNFEIIINKFLKYLDQYLNKKKVDKELIEELKAIISIKNYGSGSPSYGGWYVNLFESDDTALEFTPEVSSMFTGSSDLRDGGGIVHLGNGPVQVMYILVKDYITNEDKIFMGPVYSTYEFITDIGTRLNDEEWKKEYKNYQSLNFNK